MAGKTDSVEEGYQRIQVSEVIDCPVEDVFEFFAEDHVQNHPRWDPNMELEKETDGPMGVGTIIRRRNTNYGEPVEGTMEITEYEPNEAMGTVIRERGMEIPGRATFEEQDPDATKFTLSADFPDSMDGEMIRSNMERSVSNIKDLIESES